MPSTRVYSSDAIHSYKDSLVQGIPLSPISLPRTTTSVAPPRHSCPSILRLRFLQEIDNGRLPTVANGDHEVRVWDQFRAGLDTKHRCARTLWVEQRQDRILGLYRGGPDLSAWRRLCGPVSFLRWAGAHPWGRRADVTVHCQSWIQQVRGPVVVSSFRLHVEF